MSFNTSGGNVPTTHRADMMAFDKLPPEIRSALANAKFNISSESTLRRIEGNFFDRKEPWDTKTVIRKIRALERRIEKAKQKQEKIREELQAWRAAQRAA